MITSTASSGAPRNVSSKMVTVQILSEDGRASGSRAGGGLSSTPRHPPHSSRGGSPKPNKIHNVRGGSKLGKGSFSTGYGSLPFTITAYLPHDGGKRLKVSYLSWFTGRVMVLVSGYLKFLSCKGKTVFLSFSFQFCCYSHRSVVNK